MIFFVMTNKIKYMAIGIKEENGLYCYNCKISLKYQKKIDNGNLTESYPTCPICGESFLDNKSDVVKVSSSFTWYLDSVKFLLNTKKRDDYKIQDENGKYYTRDEFIEVLKDCPVFYHNTALCSF